MATMGTDLIAHLLADNRKLRELYMAEQRKVSMERKRRIKAEARLAALLTREVIEKKELNTSHRSRPGDDLSVVDRANKDIQENDRSSNSTDFSSDDHIALSVVNKIKKYQKKNILAPKSFRKCTTSSVRGVQDIYTAESDGKTNLSHSVLCGEQSTADPLNSRASNAQLSFAVNLLRNNYEEPEFEKLSRFWLFIDKNGEIKSSAPPPLNIQQKRKEAFIRRSTERQNLIREASMRRKELAAVKRKVAKQLLAGHTVNPKDVRMLSLMDREICAFSPQAMEHETTRRICKTREFQEKKRRRREEYDAHINRLLAYCYSQVSHRLYRNRSEIADS